MYIKIAQKRTFYYIVMIKVKIHIKSLYFIHVNVITC